MSNAKCRNFYFDNLKFFLMAIVIIIHIMEPVPGLGKTSTAVYLFTNSFVMPFFIFVTGYFSHSLLNEEKRNQKIKSLFITYVIFQFLFFLVYKYILKDEKIVFSLTVPIWLLWYIFSYLIWIPFISLFEKSKYALAASLAAALLIGLDGSVSYYLGLSRTIVFSFFFILGLQFDPDRFFAITKKIPKIIPAFLLIATFGILYIYAERIDTTWFRGSFPYERFQLSTWKGMFYRLLSFISALLTMISLSFFIPKEKNIITDHGSRTMYVYLLHGFIIKFLLVTPFYAFFTTTPKKILLLILAVGLCFLLSTKTVQHVTHWLVKPSFTINTKKSAQSAH